METVTIPKELYEELIRDSKVLNALRAAGVDCWEWYDDALESLEDD